MKAKIAGAEIAYLSEGDGTAVLFLHAFPLGLTMWDEQAAALRAGFRVVRFDGRGFGGSSPAEGLLTMERIADDAAALLDHLGISKAVVAGCSMGGYAAFAMVRRHADRIRGLVLQDTRAGADTPDARQGRAQLAEKVLKEGSQAALDAFLPKLLGETTRRERPAVVERIRGIVLGTAPRAIAAALQGLGARADSTPTLREIRVPTLVVCGQEDTITPVAESEAMHKSVLGSRLEIIAKAGHLSNLEDPVACNAVVNDFLRRL